MAGRASKNKVERAKRLTRELELRRLGFSFEAIAEQVGVSVSTAHRDVCQALAKLADANRGKTEEWRELEIQKLDALERVLQAVLRRHHVVLYKGKPVVQANPATGEVETLTDDGPVIQAIRELRALSERRCRLLGLDTPQKIEHSGADGGPIRHEYDFAALTDDELEAAIVAEAQSITGRAAAAQPPVEPAQP